MKTLGKHLEDGTLELHPGDMIYLDNKGVVQLLVIGHATPYIQPTTNDGGIGWSWDSDICKCEVVAITNIFTNKKDIPYNE